MSAMRPVDELIAARASRDELMEMIERCRPDLGPDEEAVLYTYRMTVAWLHSDTEPPVADLEAYLACAPPLEHRASTVLATCATWPTLVGEYIPPLLAELEKHYGPPFPDLAGDARRLLDRAKAAPGDDRSP